MSTETTVIDNEIETLEHLNTALQTAPEATRFVKIDSPVIEVEKNLANFVKDAFDITREDFDFGKVLQQKLTEEIQAGTFNANQLIALYSSFAVNSNDKISKLLSPIMQLMTARQQAELAAAASVAQATVQAEKVNELTKTAPKDVLQGMKQLQDFFNTFEMIKKNN